MRVALFFDGKNFFRALEKFDPEFEVSYDSLAAHVVTLVGGENGQFAGAYYYTGYSRGGGGGRGEAFGRFLSGLEFRPGFFVRREPRVRRRSIRGGRVRYYWTEKRVDTRLVADMIQLAAVDAYDCAVLFSGDQDLVPAVEAVRSLGKHVWLGHWARSGVSGELRKRCFYEIDLCAETEAIGTGRPRARGPAITTEKILAAQVEIATEAVSVDDIDSAVFGEIEKAASRFASTGGHLSEWFFLHRWSAIEPCPPPASIARGEAVARLLEAGKLEAYEYSDAKDRPTRALRLTADS